MLNYLKSDLSFQATDNKGNAIPQQPSLLPHLPIKTKISRMELMETLTAGKIKINNSDQQAQSIPTGNMDNNPQQKPEKPKLKTNVPDATKTIK
jgi:hypothetical protein